MLDVTKPSDNEAIVRLAKDTYGRLDVMFLNAGIMPSSPLSALKTDDWHAMVDVKIKGMLSGVAAVLPTFTAQKSGPELLRTISDPATGAGMQALYAAHGSAPAA